jgi:hypothetical protein
MILLDWTRMGKTYCLAGVVRQAGAYRVVRPLPLKARDGGWANVGWPPFLLDGHARWQLFELVRPEPAATRAPHLEDVWVRELRPRQLLAAPEERRAILEATRAAPPVFGHPLTLTRGSAFLTPGTGCRSLATLHVSSAGVEFRVARREGAGEADVRVQLPLAPLGERTLPLKDHFLLRRAEPAGDAAAVAAALTAAVRDMGAEVAVRLGLSRAFQNEPQQGEGVCWLMADGFFSLTDPQP